MFASMLVSSHTFSLPVFLALGSDPDHDARPSPLNSATESLTSSSAFSRTRDASPVSQHFPKDPRCLSSRARRSICLTAARGARRRRCLERKRGEAHVAGLGGDTLGDAAAQINADTLPVCAEWKLRNGVCVSVRICLFPFTAVVYIPSGCYPKSSSLSHILSSSLPPLLFLYVPVSSAVCFSQFLKGEI